MMQVIDVSRLKIFSPERLIYSASVVPKGRRHVCRPNNPQPHTNTTMTQGRPSFALLRRSRCRWVDLKTAPFLMPETGNLKLEIVDFISGLLISRLSRRVSSLSSAGKRIGNKSCPKACDGKGADRRRSMFKVTSGKDVINFLGRCRGSDRTYKTHYLVDIWSYGRPVGEFFRGLWRSTVVISRDGVSIRWPDGGE